MIFSAAVLRSIAREAAGGYPREVVGILAGSDGEVTFIEPLENVALRPSSFAVTADEMARARQAIASRALQVIGYYHSHPDGRAVLSETDVCAVKPGLVYLVMAVARGAVTGARCWRAEPRRLIPVPLSDGDWR